jgi:hypothetical protein
LKTGDRLSGAESQRWEAIGLSFDGVNGTKQSAEGKRRGQVKWWLGVVFAVAFWYGRDNGGTRDHCNKRECNQNIMHGELLKVNK